MQYYFIASCGLLAALFIVRAAVGYAGGAAKIDFGSSQTAGNRQLNADEIDWAHYGDELCLAVADGIGPGEKAKTAARVAVHITARVFERTGAGENPAFFFRSSFKSANSTILRYVPDSTAGASLLAAIIKGGRLYYALAGNCRVSICRRGELYDLSEGQTIDALARRAFKRKEISRADALEAAKEARAYNFVGKDGFMDLEMFDTPVALERGDTIALMTDGVYEFFPPGKLEGILSRRGASQALARGVTDALDRESHPEQDNASIIVARVLRV